MSETAWPFKTYGGPPVSLLRACAAKKYADKISEVGDEGVDGYWIIMKAGFWSRTMECMTIHEHTVRDAVNQLYSIEADPRPENQR